MADFEGTPVPGGHQKELSDGFVRDLGDPAATFEAQ